MLFFLFTDYNNKIESTSERALMGPTQFKKFNLSKYMGYPPGGIGIKHNVSWGFSTNMLDICLSQLSQNLLFSEGQDLLESMSYRVHDT